MKKIETIWNYLLSTAIKENKFKYQQKQLAEHFGYSLSTVHHALEVPSKQGAVRKEGKFFVLQDWRKLLYYWASVRNLSKDEIAWAFLDVPVSERESLALSDSAFAAYSAAQRWLGEPPADFEKVYFYLPEKRVAQWQERYSVEDEGGKGRVVQAEFGTSLSQRERANVIALRRPEQVDMKDGYTSLPLTFVDIWNLPDWYATDFTKALENKIDELLS